MLSHMLNVLMIIGAILGGIVALLVLINLLLVFMETSVFGRLLGARAGPKFVMMRHLGTSPDAFTILDIDVSAAYADDIGLMLARLDTEFRALAPLRLVPPTTVTYGS